MVLKSPLLLIICIIFTPFIIYADNEPSIKAKDKLLEINKGLEQLEIQLRSYDKNKACLEAVKIANSIKINIYSIKSIEPNYDWLEIREVLLEIPKAYCSD